MFFINFLPISISPSMKRLMDAFLLDCLMNMLLLQHEVSHDDDTRRQKELLRLDHGTILLRVLQWLRVTAADLFTPSEYSFPTTVFLIKNMFINNQTKKKGIRYAC